MVAVSRFSLFSLSKNAIKVTMRHIFKQQDRAPNPDRALHAVP